MDQGSLCNGQEAFGSKVGTCINAMFAGTQRLKELLLCIAMSFKSITYRQHIHFNLYG
jgi:hypothetical protein